MHQVTRKRQWNSFSGTLTFSRTLVTRVNVLTAQSYFVVVVSLFACWRAEWAGKSLGANYSAFTQDPWTDANASQHKVANTRTLCGWIFAWRSPAYAHLHSAHFHSSVRPNGTQSQNPNLRLFFSSVSLPLLLAKASMRACVPLLRPWNASNDSLDSHVN